MHHRDCGSRFRGMLYHGVCVAILIGCVCGPAVGQEESDGQAIAAAFRKIDAATRWRLVRTFEMKFDTFHPQGMAIVGDRIFVSSVEVIDRRKGQGRGHLFETDFEGNLLRSIELGEGPRYHPGGIDFDGERLWVPVAEYKRDSSSVVYVVNPETLEAEAVFRFDDHLGGVVHDRAHHVLVANSWGSRWFYRWDTEVVGDRVRVANPEGAKPIANRSHYVDFQDGQWLRGTGAMLAGGLKRYRSPGRGGQSFALGGVELIDIATLTPLHQAPILLWENGRLPLTQNPFYARWEEGRLRFYFMPADTRSTVHVYEPKLGD